MRLNINLATRPYEDVRQFLFRWGAVMLVFVLLTAALAAYAISSWRALSDVNQQISQTQAELDKLAHDRAQAVEFLSKPQNKTIADQSEFLNNAFQRRSFSWTRIFMDLEKIMPPRIHVVSITPELTRDNQIQVHLLVAGDSRDRAIELIRRMEDSSTFKRAELHSETAAQNNQNPADAIQFDISSLYIPEGGQLPPPPPRPGQKSARTGGGM